ncbi:MAG TPA: DoxX family protein [Chloroflexia bacterium]|nr:DoxX family protein [Chloroflexia bacterium]
MFSFLSRICLAVIFILGGYHAFTEPGQRHKRLPNVGLPESEELVKANAAIMMGGGALLALGIMPRIASLVLIGSLLPTTLAGHPFWKETEKASRENQQIQFAKNLGLLGGLLLVIAEQNNKKKSKAQVKLIEIS